MAEMGSGSSRETGAILRFGSQDIWGEKLQPSLTPEVSGCRGPGLRSTGSGGAATPQ